MPMQELPQLVKGKGNKIINIPTKKLKEGEESIAHIVALYESEALIVHIGRKHKVIQKAELDEYKGERGRRGKLLPPGYRNVSQLETKK